MPKITHEALEPRDWANTTPETTARHIRRYLSGVDLLHQSTDLDFGESIVLDFGCGSGYGTSILREFFKTSVGYDPNPRTLDGTHRTNVLMQDQPIDAKFDVVFCIEVIEHVASPDEVLEQIKANTGKYLVITTPIVPTTNHKPTNPYHAVEYSLPDFLDLFDGWRLLASKIEPTTFTDGETKGQGIFVFERTK